VLDLLSRVMREKIVDKIRRELGQTYTPSVALSLERGGDIGVLGVVIETTPTDVRPVIQEMKALAANLAGGAITDDDLEKARLPLLASFAKERSYNGWWLNELDGSFSYPDKLAFSRTRDQDVARISVEELRQEARRWLSRDPVIVYSGPGSSGSGKSAETLAPRPAAPP
jgi:zinc protease